MIYFVEAESVSMIKIGWTARAPESRLAALQTGSPVKLRLIAVMPGDREDEYNLHGRWAALWSHGEWFRSHPSLVEFIGDVATPWDEWVARRLPSMEKSMEKFAEDLKAQYNRELQEILSKVDLGGSHMVPREAKSSNSFDLNKLRDRS